MKTRNIFFVLISFAMIFPLSALAQDADPESREKKERTEKTRVRVAAPSYTYSSGASSSARASSSERARVSYGTGSTGDYVFTSSHSTSSSISLSKSFDGESKKSEGSFDIDDSAHNINVALSGDVEEGEINVIIQLPDGKELINMTIDDSADIQTRKAISISEDETKYYGTWKYTVEAVKAVGRYQLMIMSN